MALPLTPSFLPSPDPITVDGNRLELVANAEQRLERYLALIAAAKRSIDFIIYVFEADSAGETVRAALVAAATRGVRVRMIVDSFGSNLTSDQFFEPIRQAGGTVTFFSRRWRTSYLIRNHQKMLIVDEETLMFGGFNIAETYFASARLDGWTDLGLVLSGPAAKAMTDWFEQLHDFSLNHDGKWLKLRRMMRDWQISHPPHGALQWLVGGPTQRLSPWARSIRTDLSVARRIDMVMAYFSPGQGMLRRLGRAARRGPVRLITAARSDNGATIGAARLLYGYLLRKRLAILEYQPQRLHMKLIVADDAVFVGSANFDMRSLFVNVELMLRVEDVEFAKQARAIIDQVVEASAPITRDWIKQRVGLMTRVRWTLSWIVVSIIDYSVVRHLNFGLETGPDNDGRQPPTTPTTPTI